MMIDIERAWYAVILKVRSPGEGVQCKNRFVNDQRPSSNGCVSCHIPEMLELSRGEQLVNGMLKLLFAKRFFDVTGVNQVLGLLQDGGV